jgi:hypothetical protein
MALVESQKDLIGLLLILRSVCAQNKGSVKVDEEFQNLNTLHQAIGYRQNNTVNNTTYGEDVLNRYESAIFTCGKFAFGRTAYDAVLLKYSTPMTSAEYILLSEDDQKPIDDIVKERTVARLIIKNSLNEQLREYLVHTYSVNNNSCYPNTISDAVSLLSTFTKAPAVNNNTAAVADAVVSYHEADEDTIEYDDVSQSDVLEDNDVDHVNNNIDHDDDHDETEDTNKQVSFETTVKADATVMAAVIAEAAADVEDTKFFGASFAQIQEVDDVYEDDEPDLVCYAHVTDTDLAYDIGSVQYELDDDGDEPIFVTDANNNAEIQNQMLQERRAIINRVSDPLKDFELMIYHTAQRVLHKDSQKVGILHYAPGRPDLISHTYGRNIPESIIDYSDALRFKFKCAGIHNTDSLMEILLKRTDIDVMSIIKQKFNDVGLKGINTSTVKILRQETIRNIAHREYNSIRYHSMQVEIGMDDVMETFPRDNTILHHVVSSVAIEQVRRKPNRWVNKITHKLINSGITSIGQLESKVNNGTLNDHLDDHDMARLHAVTIMGLTHIIGVSDFRQGRS